MTKEIVKLDNDSCSRKSLRFDNDSCSCKGVKIDKRVTPALVSHVMVCLSSLFPDCPGPWADDDFAQTDSDLTYSLARTHDTRVKNVLRFATPPPKNYMTEYVSPATQSSLT